ncbi:hypothetical protein DPV73_12615 [Leptospira mayottensis]|nr:hypothetical protein DPV73_12615 [Leptospira mayottensis]
MNRYQILFKRGSDLRTLFSVSKSSYGQITHIQYFQYSKIGYEISFKSAKKRFSFFVKFIFFF